MLRKALLILTLILFFLALGLGIVAHAIYTSNGQINATVAGCALGAIVSIFVAFIILRRVTGDKPVDLEKTFNANRQRARLGAFLMAFGVIVLALLTPLIYGAIEAESTRMGVEGMISEFPIASVRPAMRWLYDGFGTVGVISPVLIFGLFLVVYGWRLFRPSRG